MSDDIIGPALPPGFKLQQQSNSDNDSNEISTYAGPILPPDFKIATSDFSHSQKISSTDEISSENRRRCIGPVLPAGLKVEGSGESEDSSESSEDSDEEDRKEKCDSQAAEHGKQFIGPVVPSMFVAHTSDGEESDEDVIGPMPFTGSAEEYASSTAIEFARRAEKMKNKLLNKVSIW